MKRGNPGSCHVCGVEKGTDIYMDGDGNYLLACNTVGCTFSYRYLMPFSTWQLIRRIVYPNKRLMESRLWQLGKDRVFR